MTDHAHVEDQAHAHDHGPDHDEHQHSHVKLYTITAVVLTLITAVELLVVPDFWHLVFQGNVEELSNDIVVPSLYVLAILKFAGVIGLFMHLKDDKKIYSDAPFLLGRHHPTSLPLQQDDWTAPFEQGFPWIAGRIPFVDEDLLAVALESGERYRGRHFDV